MEGAGAVPNTEVGAEAAALNTEPAVVAVKAAELLNRAELAVVVVAGVDPNKEGVDDAAAVVTGAAPNRVLAWEPAAAAVGAVSVALGANIEDGTVAMAGADTKTVNGNSGIRR